LKEHSFAASLTLLEIMPLWCKSLSNDSREVESSAWEGSEDADGWGGSSGFDGDGSVNAGVTGCFA